MKFLRMCALMLCALGALSACGKKGDLSPPPSYQHIEAR